MAEQGERPVWLGIREVAQHWSAESGEPSKDIEHDLSTWLNAFGNRSAAELLSVADACGTSFGSLVGQLGKGRVHRHIFEIYCNERERPLPDFWDKVASAATDPDEQAAESESAEAQNGERRSPQEAPEEPADAPKPRSRPALEERAALRAIQSSQPRAPQPSESSAPAPQAEEPPAAATTATSTPEPTTAPSEPATKPW